MTVQNPHVQFIDIHHSHKSKIVHVTVQNPHVHPITTVINQNYSVHVTVQNPHVHLYIFTPVIIGLSPSGFITHETKGARGLLE
jgi:hypothetical protein